MVVGDALLITTSCLRYSLDPLERVYLGLSCEAHSPSLNSEVDI